MWHPSPYAVNYLWCNIDGQWFTLEIGMWKETTVTCVKTQLTTVGSVWIHSGVLQRVRLCWALLWHLSQCTVSDWWCKMNKWWSTLESRRPTETTLTCFKPHSWLLWAPDEPPVVYCREWEGAGDHCAIYHHASWGTCKEKWMYSDLLGAVETTTICVNDQWWAQDEFIVIYYGEWHDAGGCCSIHHSAWQTPGGCTLVKFVEWDDWDISRPTVEHCRVKMNTQ